MIPKDTVSMDGDRTATTTESEAGNQPADWKIEIAEDRDREFVRSLELIDFIFDNHEKYETVEVTQNHIPGGLMALDLILKDEAHQLLMDKYAVDSVIQGLKTAAEENENGS